jgi:hypothetical protein
MGLRKRMMKESDNFLEAKKWDDNGNWEERRRKNRGVERKEGIFTQFFRCVTVLR